MSLIAIRRNLPAGAVFFQQSGSKLLYSLDNVTWYEAYDFSTFTPAQASQTTVNAWSTYNTINETYLGDATNINVNWAPTTGLDETARKQVICYMVDLVLKTKIAQVRELYRLQDAEEDNGLAIAAGFIGAAAAIIGVAAVVIGTGGTATIPLVGIGVSGGSLGFIGAGLGLGAIGTELYAALTAPNTNHLDDTEAIDAYRCRAYNILTASPITPETWVLAFAQFTDTENANVEILSGDVASLTDTTDLAFALSGLSGLLDGMFDGLFTLPDICVECEAAGEWCYELDFRLQSYENYLIRYQHTQLPTALTGEWQSGIGWVATNYYGGTDRGEQQVQLAQEMPLQVLRFKIRYTYVEGTWVTTAGITKPQLWYYQTNNPVTLPQGTLVTGESVYTTSARAGWRVDLRVAYDRVAPVTLGGTGILERLRIKGSGHNPFGFSNAVYDDPWGA